MWRYDYFVEQYVIFYYPITNPDNRPFPWLLCEIVYFSIMIIIKTIIIIIIIWYAHYPKCTHFSVFIFSQLLAGCFISLRGESWAHRTSLDVREYRKGNAWWTIQRDWQHWVHNTQGEDKTKTQHNTAIRKQKIQVNITFPPHKQLDVKTNRTTFACHCLLMCLYQARKYIILLAVSIFRLFLRF